MTNTTQHKCPVRGHEHDLIIVSHHTQANTGIKAVTVECPSTHMYRWLVIDNVFNDRMRTKRPRYGWKN